MTRLSRDVNAAAARCDRMPPRATAANQYELRYVEVQADQPASPEYHSFVTSTHLSWDQPPLSQATVTATHGDEPGLGMSVPREGLVAKLTWRLGTFLPASSWELSANFLLFASRVGTLGT